MKTKNRTKKAAIKKPKLNRDHTRILKELTKAVEGVALEDMRNGERMENPMLQLLWAALKIENAYRSGKVGV